MKLIFVVGAVACLIGSIVARTEKDFNDAIYLAVLSVINMLSAKEWGKD